MKEDTATSRRRLLGGLLLVPAVACKLEDTGARAIARLSELEPGVPIPFDDARGIPAFLVKLGTPAEGGVGPDADVVAFHTACPHQGCPLPIARVDGGVTTACVCHLSTFDLTRSGRLVVGPATQSLPRVLVEVRGDDIVEVGQLGTPYGTPASVGVVS